MYKILQLNRAGTAVNNPEDITNFPPVEILSDADLWQLVLTPINHALPQIAEYFKQAEREFSNRKVILKPIMNC